MDGMQDTYDNTYAGYQQFQADATKEYDKILDKVDDLPPNLALIYMIGFLLYYEQALTGWTASELNGISDDLNDLSKLQSAFSQESGVTEGEPPVDNDSVRDGIDAGCDLYYEMKQISEGDPNNPLYSISKTIMSDLENIIPVDVLNKYDPSADNHGLSDADYNEVESYWVTSWQESRGGTPDEVTKISEAFSSGFTTFGGPNQAAQTMFKYQETMQQDLLGIFNAPLKAMTDQINFMNQAMANASG